MKKSWETRKAQQAQPSLNGQLDININGLRIVGEKNEVNKGIVGKLVGELLA